MGICFNRALLIIVSSAVGSTTTKSQAQTLPIPAVSAGQSNNYFVAGTGDGGTLTTYNSFLRLHSGLAIGSPFVNNGSGGYTEKATIAFDGRSGNIGTLGSLAIGKTGSPDFAIDVSTSGDFRGMQFQHSSGNWSRFYTSLPSFSFNGITLANDAGFVFGNSGGSVQNGFVIAPHQGATSGLRIDKNGNVGIGAQLPQAKLHVKDGSVLSSDVGYENINARLDGRSIPALYFTRWTGTGSIQHNAFVGQFSNSAAGGEYSFGIGTGYSATGDQSNHTKTLTVLLNGNVGIGTTNPNQKLTVNGTIYSKEVKVDLSVPGPDYVFEKDYHLPSLESVKTYIDQNKHLPEVPSAKEMEANGVNLSEMNMLLLKKIEELTLYVFELKKENMEQSREISKLKNASK